MLIYPNESKKKNNKKSINWHLAGAKSELQMVPLAPEEPMSLPMATPGGPFSSLPLTSAPPTSASRFQHPAQRTCPQRPQESTSLTWCLWNVTNENIALSYKHTRSYILRSTVLESRRSLRMCVGSLNQRPGAGRRLQAAETALESLWWLRDTWVKPPANCPLLPYQRHCRHRVIISWAPLIPASSGPSREHKTSCLGPRG
jgi:hypothetical protein